MRQHSRSSPTCEDRSHSDLAEVPLQICVFPGAASTRELPLLCYSQRYYQFSFTATTDKEYCARVHRCRQAIVDPRRLRSSQVMSARMLLRPHQSPSELSLRQQLLKITIVSVYPSRHASPYTLSVSLLPDCDSFHFGVPVSICTVSFPASSVFAESIY